MKKTIDYTIVTREEAGKVDPNYEAMLKTEAHHQHEIIRDEHGVLRWKEKEPVRMFLRNILMNDLGPLLTVLGYGLNSEIYRHMYRCMGYSLSGYYDVFYWSANNEDCDKYTPPSPNPAPASNIQEIRQAFADYMATEGCSCCQDIYGHKEAMQKLGTMLGMDQYADGSGFDYGKYKSK